ncbi:MAG: carboxypeptidase-like regulatory domain-containing protein [Planctomycetota bacterium]
MTRPDDALDRNLKHIFQSEGFDEAPSARFEGELSLALRRRAARRRPERRRHRRHALVTIAVAASVLIGLTLWWASHDRDTARWRLDASSPWLEIAGGSIDLDRGILQSADGPLVVQIEKGAEARLAPRSELRLARDDGGIAATLIEGRADLEIRNARSRVTLSAGTVAIRNDGSSDLHRVTIELASESVVTVSAESGSWMLTHGERLMSLPLGARLSFDVTERSGADARSAVSEPSRDEPGPEGDETAVLQGRVADQDGRGLGRVPVTLVEPGGASSPGRTVRIDTGADGSFTAELESGSWQAFAGGETWGRVGPFAIDLPRTEELHITVAPARALSGWVENTAGRRLADVAVTAIGLSDSELTTAEAQARTDESGAFRIAGIGPGRYRLMAETTEHGPGEILAATAGDSDLAIVLPGLASLRGRVRWALSGEAVTDTFGVTLEPIVARYDRPEALERELQSPEGELEWSGIPAGSYRAWISVPGGASWRSEVLTLDGRSPAFLSAEIETGGWIIGTVLTASGESVAGARVMSLTDAPPSASVLIGNRPGPWAARSDTKGRFRLGPLSPGTHRLQVVAPGTGVLIRERVEVRRDVDLELTLQLEAGSALHGILTSGGSETREGRQYLLLRATGEAELLTAIATTDARGEFLVESLIPGEYFVIETGSEEDPTLANVRVLRASLRSGETTELELGERPSLGRLEGRVRDVGGRAVPRMTVLVVEDDFFRSGTSDENGDYRVLGIPGGRYQVLLQRGFARSMTTYGTIDIEGGQSKDYDIVLPTGRLHGRVVRAETEEPIRGARLLLYRPGRSRESFGGRTESTGEGVFAFEDLHGGPGALVVVAPGHGTTVLTDILIPSEASSEERIIRVPRGTDLSLEVRDARSGEPVRGAFTLLFLPDGPPLSDPTVPHFTDASGQVVFRGARPGPARVLIQHSDYGERWAEVTIDPDTVGSTPIEITRD